MKRIGRVTVAAGMGRRLPALVALVLIVGATTPVAATEPTLPGPAFEVDGDEISGWWWLRDAAGAQHADWVFGALPAGDEVILDLELLATDTASGGPGVDAAVWLRYGPTVDGAMLDAVTAPLLLVIPNVSPPQDPVGYTTRGSFGFPMTVLALAASDAASGRFASTGSVGLWVTMGRLGPDGSVLPDHVAVREASVRLRDIAGDGTGTTP